MIGQTVSHYRILEKLGAGGMGIVYKAEDVRLGRTVALKFLPAELTRDATARERFILEAKAASALDHPNIYTIHEIDETPDGRTFICMAYYDGESLKEKLHGEPLALDTAVSIAAQLADGLAKAHDEGLVHRDIKPENIMVTNDGVAKIVDFGIVKLLGGTQITSDKTTIGTVAYMSPVQVRGDNVDARSDIFSLGTVLYEMLTGQPPFRGDHPASILYSITTEQSEPPSRINPQVSPEMDRIVATALAKNPAARYPTAARLAADLRGTVEPGAAGAARSADRRRVAFRFLWPAVFVALGLMVVRSIRERTYDPSSQSGSIRAVSVRSTSQLTFSESLEEWPAWSPDGTRLTYTAEVDGFKKLFVRSLETSDPEQLTHGPRDDIQPVWSPDGKSIAFVRSNLPNGRLAPSDVLGFFFEGGDIHVLDPSDGSTAKVIDEAFNPAFSPDGSTIAFDATWAGPRRIWMTDQRGRNPRQLTTDASEAVAHVSPTWSPDGARIAFRRVEKTRADIEMINIDGQSATRLTNDGFNDIDPEWSVPGSRVFFSSNRGGGLNIWSVPVENGRAGTPEQVTTGAGNDVQSAVSPDGNRLAFSVLGLNSDLWRLPMNPTTGRPAGAPEALITTTREDSRGAWSPDGTLLAFNSDRLGDMNIWILSLGDGSERQVTKGAGGDFQGNWSPDGREIVFFSSRAGNLDLWKVELAGGTLRQLTDHSGLDVNPFFSPDGGSIAFQSDRGGRSELWVMRADGSEPRRVADVEASGHYMRWWGGRLLFASGDGADRVIYTVDAGTGELTTMPKISSGAHMSFSPDRSLVLDVVGHNVLWFYPVTGTEATRIFEFDNPDIRIDYPVWSPDGRWAVFDRVAPQGGDIWLLEAPE